MSNLNKVTLSLRKIKSKNLEQNQVYLVNYLVKDYSFTNDEAEALITKQSRRMSLDQCCLTGKHPTEL